MSATRNQDDMLVNALAMLCRGVSMAETARRVGKQRAALRIALRKVLREDLMHDDPAIVLPRYPKIIVESYVA